MTGASLQLGVHGIQLRGLQTYQQPMRRMNSKNSLLMKTEVHKLVEEEFICVVMHLELVSPIQLW